MIIANLLDMDQMQIVDKGTEEHISFDAGCILCGSLNYYNLYNIGQKKICRDCLRKLKYLIDHLY